MRRIASHAIALLALCAAQWANASDAVPRSWIEVSADGNFSIMAPPGTTFARSTGVDSFTGVFNAPGFAVHVDFGAHVDPLTPQRTRTEYLTRTISVDGRPAMLITARNARGDRAYFIGLHVARVRSSVVGPVGLTLIASVQRQQELATVETVYRSVRFK